MSTSLTINGQSYNYPEDGDTSGWGNEATNWASAVTNGMLQKAGGSFILTADVDFGATYGLKSTYFSTRTSNPASAGTLRLSTTEVLSWRDNGNTADLDLSPGTDDLLEFDSIDLVNISTAQTLTNKTIDAAANTLTGVVTLTDTQTLTNKTLNDASNDIHADATHLEVRNVSGSTIAKGTPVSITGFNSGQDLVTVGPSDADTASTNPAIGVADEELVNNTNGHIIVSGELINIDTATPSWTIGDALYVSGTAGELTSTRPLETTEFVQAVAKVTKVHVSAGRILVTGAGRANDYPNLFGEMHVEVTASTANSRTMEIITDAAGFGSVKGIQLDYDTGVLSAGEEGTVINISVDELDATGGHICGLNIDSTDGSADVHAIRAGVNIAPIHHDSGTYANPTTGTNNTQSTDVSAMIDGNSGTTTSIFVADDDYILVGSGSEFREIQLVLTTGSSSQGIEPTFWYSITGTHQFTQFFPIDGTDGLKHSGIISWYGDSFVSHVADAVTGTYDIKIIRTKNTLSTNPVLGYAKTAATTEYLWDKDANLCIATVAPTQTAGTTLLLRAYDVDGASWTTFATLTSNNTPTMDLDATVTHDGNVIVSAGDIGSSIQAWDAQLDDIAALSVTNGNIIVGDGTNWVAETGATARTSLGLTIGTDVQAYDATLLSIATLGTAADKMLYTTGIDTWAEADITAAGRALLDDAAASNQRTTMGVAIGSDVQAWDAQLDDIAALAVTNSNIIVGDGTNWVAESGATARTSLGVAIGTDVQAYNSNLLKFDIHFLLPSGANDTFTLTEYSSFPFTIDKAYYKTDSGSITASIKIGGTSITGLSSLSLTTSQNNSTASGANTMSTGSKLTCVTTSNSSGDMISITLHCTRT